MRRMRIAGPGLAADRLQAYQAPQPAHPVAAGDTALTPQMPRHLPATVEWIGEEQLVDPARRISASVSAFSPRGR